MNRLILAAALILVLSVVAGAQTAKTDGTYDVPPDRIYDPGHCNEYRVKALYAATNPNDPMQEGYLRMAEAYRQLDLAGQRC